MSKIYKNTLLDLINCKEGDILIKIHNYYIDNYGELMTKYSKQKMEFPDYIKLCKLNKNYDIIFYWMDQKKLINTQIKFDNINYLNYEEITPIFYNFNYKIYHYELLGGLVIIPINKKLCDCKNIKKMLNNKLVVTYVFPESIFKFNNTIDENHIIHKINDIKIYDFNDIYNLLENIKSKFLKIKTKNSIEYIEIKILYEEMNKIILSYNLKYNGKILNILKNKI